MKWNKSLILIFSLSVFIHLVWRILSHHSSPNMRWLWQSGGFTSWFCLWLCCLNAAYRPSHQIIKDISLIFSSSVYLHVFSLGLRLSEHMFEGVWSLWRHPRPVGLQLQDASHRDISTPTTAHIHSSLDEDRLARRQGKDEAWSIFGAVVAANHGGKSQETAFLWFVLLSASYPIWIIQIVHFFHSCPSDIFYFDSIYSFYLFVFQFSGAVFITHQSGKEVDVDVCLILVTSLKMVEDHEGVSVPGEMLPYYHWQMLDTSQSSSS